MKIHRVQTRVDRLTKERREAGAEGLKRGTKNDSVDSVDRRLCTTNCLTDKSFSEYRDKRLIFRHSANRLASSLIHGVLQYLYADDHHAKRSLDQFRILTLYSRSSQYLIPAQRSGGLTLTNDRYLEIYLMDAV